MTRDKMYAALSAKIPASLSEEWDNDGEMCVPSSARQVEKVLCTLDVTDEVVAYAVRHGYDLILSHHPLVFHGVKAINSHDPVSRRLLTLVQNDIAVFSFHTRLDAAQGGINDALAEMLSLKDVTAFASLGRIGDLPQAMPFDAFAQKVKELLHVPVLNVRRVNETVSCVAIVGGEGKDFLEEAACAGADTYVSGRLGYHAMLDGEINLIECGHYFSEKHAASLLADMVQSIDPNVRTEIYTPNLLSVY